MNKQYADNLISQYRDKIFGFSLRKMRNISQAEELASDIISEVYLSFLSSENIANPDGYVYRVACNVYSKYIHKLTTGRNFEDISEISLPYYDDNFITVEQEEDIDKLRKEISFLSERQRSIIYLFYYERKSVSDIAQKLKISQGTVKWHLSDARSTLKEELTMEKNNNYLAVNPIKFIYMGHNGYTGSKGDTKDMFDTQLKQNIAFACYYEAQTVEQIARKLNVPVAYIADEIKILYEYGYIDKLDNSKRPKYRTNMYITDLRNSDTKTEQNMYRQAAKFMCDKFYPKVFEDFDNADDNWGFFCDGNDKNFMKYNIVMLAVNFAYTDHANDTKNFEKLAVKRPDGGHFIAGAAVDDCYADRDMFKDPYWSCGYMTRTSDSIAKISVDCRFSNRSKDTWRDDLESDWDSLYKFIKSGNDKNSLTAEEYKRLCDKAYVYDDKVQVMAFVSSELAGSNTVFNSYMNELRIQVPDEVLEYCNEFDKKMYEISAKNFPEHIRPIVKLYCTHMLSEGHFIPYLIEEMLDRGMLKPLTDLQKKSVFTVVAYK